jgi:hypothetical protein
MLETDRIGPPALYAGVYQSIKVNKQDLGAAICISFR